MAARKYLSLYNAVSGALWTVVLLRLLVVLPLVGFEYASEGVGDLLTYVQSLAVLEVVHAALGLVRSNWFTVLMQVASRLFLVWGVLKPFPTVAATPVYSVLVVAWCLAEMVRYPYYYAQLQHATPRWLEFLRYNMFIVLYPVGVGAEMILTYRALPLASYYHPTWALVMKLVMIIYPPALYKLYMHMLHARTKALKK